jgi:hypothetical protein
MKRRLPVLGLIAGFLVVVGAVAAFALTPPAGVDPGVYTACVNSRTGAIRMVEVEAGDAPWPACNPAKEYSVAWANGFSIEGYSNTNSYSEHVTTSTWFHQLACPESREPLGGGGAFLPDDQGAGQMALQSSVPTVDDDLGGLHGWEVFFASVDGLEHTGTFQIFAICAPATSDG